MSGPSTSSSMTGCEELETLVEMFPDASRDALRESLSVHGTVTRAAIA